MSTQYGIDQFIPEETIRNLRITEDPPIIIVKYPDRLVRYDNVYDGYARCFISEICEDEGTRVTTVIADSTVLSVSVFSYAEYIEFVFSASLNKNCEPCRFSVKVEPGGKAVIRIVDHLYAKPSFRLVPGYECPASYPLESELARTVIVNSCSDYLNDDARRLASSEGNTYVLSRRFVATTRASGTRVVYLEQ